MPWYEWLYIVLLILLLIEISKLIRILFTRPRLTEEAIHEFPFISIIIPARNEADRLPSLLEGLSQQDYPSEKFEVIVVDDHSEDGTTEVSESFKNKIGNLFNLQVGDLPTGWSGKSFACYTGAREAHGEYLCFVDADVSPAPTLIRQTMAYELRYHLAALSLAPHQHLVSWAEKILLLPVFTMIAANLRTDEKILNGQFILFDKNVYEAIGGHDIDRVRNAISEDLGMAEYLQEKNYAIDFVFAEHLLSCRMYNGYDSVSKGVSKLIVRLMDNNVWKAAWVSLIYFLFALTGLISLILFFSGHLHRDPLMLQSAFLSIPVLLLGVSLSLTFYFRIFIVYGFLIPFGFLYQPVFFFLSIRGKLRKYYEWRGRKVFN